mmetsp:Transcript_15583/g.33846  ORF Transcript_15583/g.33846 Transcript_15583/m.33846 type:complete len:82 (+) Transcript_15583:1220-1465(+)
MGWGGYSGPCWAECCVCAVLRVLRVLRVCCVLCCVLLLCFTYPSLFLSLSSLSQRDWSQVGSLLGATLFFVLIVATDIFHG